MKRYFRSLGIFIEKRYLLIIAVTALLIVPSIYGASRITMASGNDTFISPDSKLYQDFTRFSRNFSGSTLAVLVEAPDGEQLLSADNIKAMESVETRMSQVPGVKSSIGPSFFIKQAMAKQTGSATMPQDPAMVAAIVKDPATGGFRTAFASVFPDQQHALIAIILDGGMQMDDSTTGIIDEANAAVADAGFSGGVQPIVTGEPVIFQQLNQAMGNSMRYMMLTAVILMLTILAVIFKVRNFFAWRWLPLGIVMIAIIYAFGVMGALSIPITMVTMAAFPVLIGLGVDYAIQFHNRYDEEARRGETVGEAVIDSITHVGPAIGIAIITACLGFAALFFSPIPMIKDFGYTLIIGVVSCYILAVFLLMSILYWNDRRKEPAETAAAAGAPPADTDGGMPELDVANPGFVERILHRLAPGVIHSPYIIVPVALILCVVGIVLDGRIGTETDTLKFMNSDMPALRDLKKLQAIAGGRSSASVFVEAADVTDPAVLGWLDATGQEIKRGQTGRVEAASSIVDIIKQATGGQLPQDGATIRQIMDGLPPAVKGNMVNADYTAANLSLSTGELSSDQVKQLNSDLAGYVDDPPAGVSAVVTGGTVVEDAVISGLTEGREKMTLIGIGFVFAGLLVLFRLNIVKALLAILPIGLIIGWSAIVMNLLGIVYTPVTATLGALIIGIGVEFTILLMMRYYEERENGEEPEVAMTTAMTKIGRAIIASGLTVVAGFGALLIARDFPILQDFGIVTMINVLFALVSTLLVLPALIVLVDSRLNRRSAAAERA